MSQQHTVLIIDDNEEDRYFLKRYLNKTDLSLIILEVSSGSAGLDLLTTPIEDLQSSHPLINGPVTLFLDINMPLMDGWEFIEELERRQSEIQLQPNIIMMYSSSDSVVDKNKAKGYKTVSNYVVKGKHTPDGLKQIILANIPV